MKVAVTGATGIVGRFVTEKLADEGATIRALTRSASNGAGPSTVARMPTGIEWVVGDMGDAQALGCLVEGVDAVVHCAYQHAPGRYRGGEGDDLSGFWQANLLGGLELMRQTRLAGASRLVVMSSRAVFGQPSPTGHWVDDETRPVPDTHYGALKLALEAHASAFAAADGVCFASLRPTGVYGLAYPVERSKWLDLASALIRRQPLPTARMATEVHGRDVAAAVWLLITSPAERIAGRAFNCSDLVVDTRDVMKRLARCLRIRPELPERATNELRNPMKTPALHALGWRPGGSALLERTINELAATAADGSQRAPFP